MSVTPFCFSALDAVTLKLIQTQSAGELVFSTPIVFLRSEEAPAELKGEKSRSTTQSQTHFRRNSAARDNKLYI